jgi:hypothetical protein
MDCGGSGSAVNLTTEEDATDGTTPLSTDGSGNGMVMSVTSEELTKSDAAAIASCDQDSSCDVTDNADMRHNGVIDESQSLTNNNERLVSETAAHNQDQRRLNEIQKDKYLKLTTVYDDYAVVHLTYGFFPLIIGFGLYSLIYYKHTSWWSWLVSALADYVYMFGFIAMTPQLYINYKFHSVAHLPLNAMMYKIFCTFVDDIYAWMTNMPWKHRLMTMRDDLIFIGFIYQW